MQDEHGNELECMNEYQGSCEGEVEYRESMTGTGTPMKRCHFHHWKAVENHRAINERYPVHAPADFDPSYAGESWDGDY